MKLFICADIEGTCGITDWKETLCGKPEHEYFRRQMSAEVAAVCRGALKGGFTRVVVRDAHGTAMNIIPEMLPEQTRIYRGWTGDPYCMLSGLDSSFSGVVFTGFHSPAGNGGSPLSHTMNTSLYSVKINGRAVSEFLINAYTASYIGVPLLLLTGDYGICFEAEKELPGLPTVSTQICTGGSTLSLHPKAAEKLIEQTAEEVLTAENTASATMLPLPDRFSIEVSYKEHKKAHRLSFYPGAFLRRADTVVFECTDYYEALRFMHFCM